MAEPDVSFPIRLPPVPLRPYVAVAHGYRVPANPSGLHRGLPSRHLTLVVELARPLRITGLSGRISAHAVVGGLHTEPVLINASDPQEGLQYGLTPLGAYALLGVPAGNLCRQTVDLVELFGRHSVGLLEQLQATAGWGQRFAVLDRALLSRLGDRTPRLPAEVAQAWRLVFASDGRIRVADVAEQVGWGRRHLSERFRRTTGLTVKEAARIARFEAVRRLLLSPAPPPLAELAVRCGYADQPHLAREWRALSGCSVGTWLRDELPFVQDAAATEPAGSLA